MMLAALALTLGQAAPAAACSVEVPQGLEIPLATVMPLTSKIQVKGDMVDLTVTEDVRIGDRLVIPKGTPATGQVADSQQRGGMGVGGKLLLRPLYLRVGGTVVRLAGRSAKNGGTPAGSVIGIAVLNGGILLSGATAKIPAGSKLDAIVDRATSVKIGEGAGC